MSFNNPFESDLESTRTNQSYKYQDFPEFDSLTTTIENQLHHINHRLVRDIKHDLVQYERGQVELGEKLSEQFKQTTGYFKKVNEVVKQVNLVISNMEQNKEDVEIIGYLRQRESIQIKLIKDGLVNFKNLQKRFESLTGQQQESQSQSTTQQSETHQTDSQIQTQVQITYEPINAEELEQQTLLVQQREHELQQIHHDTLEINEIFSNLSSIIQEQQFQVDSIENNIFSYMGECCVV
ncbi:Syntaxin PEP12 [Spathaspora sp. JA1]|nr:Syntaxin PEP12 [Spathaspora sp. JA1]